MDLEQKWGVKVPLHTDDSSIEGHRYNHVIASRLVIAVDAKNLIVVQNKRRASAWEQLRLSQNADGTALHAPLD